MAGCRAPQWLFPQRSELPPRSLQGGHSREAMGNACCKATPELPPEPVSRNPTYVKPAIEKREVTWSVDIMKGEQFKFMEPFATYPQHGLEIPQFANNSSTADFVFEYAPHLSPISPATDQKKLLRCVRAVVGCCSTFQVLKGRRRVCSACRHCGRASCTR